MSWVFSFATGQRFTRNIFRPSVFLRAMQEFGPMETARKLYYYDELKFGTLMGTDSFGNKYYENRAELYGTGRRTTPHVCAARPPPRLHAIKPHPTWLCAG